MTTKVHGEIDMSQFGLSERLKLILCALAGGVAIFHNITIKKGNTK